MKYIVKILFFLTFVTTDIYAASYDYIDSGDRYYVNGWFDDNEYVEVVRKLGNGEVKVRSLRTGDTIVISASKLLTAKQLDSEETTNALGAGVVVGCLLTGACK